MTTPIKNQSDSKKPAGDKRAGRRGENVSLHPLSPEEALADLLRIPPKPTPEKDRKTDCK